MSYGFVRLRILISVGFFFYSQYSMRWIKYKIWKKQQQFSIYFLMENEPKHCLRFRVLFETYGKYDDLKDNDFIQK